eukprot:CAMPEP_0206517526 /NCGR_PEP_ID=MMETSP0324_2-20121206/64031_1 /ASSEMBLY_ACC=CAM_ASM_000836 /TAXON_ID=2866 /ORGANISM="Crypthecodinium cohnii, Strain Seligo" /LENGTH=236 /DNA_ID=CAMNT_0054010699 /DNA_START=82 /DNA_END=790 /DNA_ORIENTATION=+
MKSNLVTPENCAEDYRLAGGEPSVDREIEDLFLLRCLNREPFTVPIWSKPCVVVTDSGLDDVAYPGAADGKVIYLVPLEGVVVCLGPIQDEFPCRLSFCVVECYKDGGISACMLDVCGAHADVVLCPGHDLLLLHAIWEPSPQLPLVDQHLERSEALWTCHEELEGIPPDLVVWTLQCLHDGGGDHGGVERRVWRGGVTLGLLDLLEQLHGPLDVFRIEQGCGHDLRDGHRNVGAF